MPKLGSALSKFRNILNFRTKLELYFLPAILIVFFINHHYFQWHNNSYKKSLAFLNNLSIKDRYERIQSQHPYYEIYGLAKDYKGNEDKILFVFELKSPDMLDYTSTYYESLRTGKSEEKVAKHLSELGLFIDYFFYPESIRIMSLEEFKKHGSTDFEVVISDIDLPNFLMETNIRLSPIEISHKEILGPNQKPTKVYYLFHVIKSGL